MKKSDQTPELATIVDASPVSLTIQEAIPRLIRSMKRFDFLMALHNKQRDAELQLVNDAITALNGEQPSTNRMKRQDSHSNHDLFTPNGLNIQSKLSPIPQKPSQTQKQFGSLGGTVHFDLNTIEPKVFNFTFFDEKKSEPKSSEASKSLAAVYFLPPTVQIVSLDLLSENHENSEIRKAKMEFQDSKPIKFTAPSVNKIGSFRADSSSTNYPPKCAPKLCTLEITTSSQGTQKEEYENQHTDNTQQETNGSSSLENVDIDVEPTKCNVAQLVGSPFSPQSATETTEQYRAQQYKDFDDLTTKDLPSIVRDLECSVRSYRGFRSPYPKK